MNVVQFYFAQTHHVILFVRVISMHKNAPFVFLRRTNKNLYFYSLSFVPPFVHGSDAAEHGDDGVEFLAVAL